MVKNDLKRAGAGSHTVAYMFKRKKMLQECSVSLRTQSPMSAPMDKSLPSSPSSTTDPVSSPVTSSSLDARPTTSSAITREEISPSSTTSEGDNSSVFSPLSKQKFDGIPDVPVPPNGLNDKSPNQVYLKKFPSRKFGSSSRSFSSTWYKGRPWLEYSVETDSAYCFPCRVFGVNPSSAKFTVEGYDDWKHALDGWNELENVERDSEKKKMLKGFAKHVLSGWHIKNMEAWRDKQQRDTAGTTIEAVVNKLNNEHKIWLEVIFNVIRHLAADGLPLRGHDENLDFEEGLSGGLFLNTLENLVFQLRPELVDLAKRLPKNAKYLSPDIQNEFVDIMANMVRDAHAEKVKAAEFFTIMVDGTTDKSNEEIQGLVVRYFDIITEEMEERCLNVDGTGRSAEDVFEFVRKTLEDDCGIGFHGLVTQAYDGASVMSGNKGGLQALVNNYCDRIIAYIHCFCHRLHLVVGDAMKNIAEINSYFSTVSGLYTFFKLAAVKEQYGGGTLKRLLDTRWSGHLASCKAVNENYSDVVKTLGSALRNSKLDSTERATAVGFRIQTASDDFLLLGHFVQEVLKNCDIANKILQSSNENLVSAMSSISAVRETLKDKRREYTDDKIVDIIEKKRGEAGINDSRSSRKTTVPPSYLRDSIITDYVPNRNNTNLRAVVTSCIDRMEADFTSRFSSQNTAVWSSMESLVPSWYDTFLDPKLLEPMFYWAVAIPAVRNKFTSQYLNKADMDAECKVFRKVLQKEFEKGTFEHEKRKGTIDLLKVCCYMVKNQNEAAPVLTVLYRLAVTAGYASARCECVFSSLTKVDAPQRRSQSTNRETNMTFLYFEKKALMELKFEDFLKIWESKPRNLVFH